jgi:hypothetical protein
MKHKAYYNEYAYEGVAYKQNGKRSKSRDLCDKRRFTECLQKGAL